MTTSDQWRADFHQHYRDALVALCADADARMVASPPECRRIRLAVEQALATLPQDIQPCASWPADKQAAFAGWRIELIVALALTKATQPQDPQEGK